MTAHRHHVVRNGVENVSPIVATNTCELHPFAASENGKCLACWWRQPETDRPRLTLPGDEETEQPTPMVSGSGDVDWILCGNRRCDRVFARERKVGKPRLFCCAACSKSEMTSRARERKAHWTSWEYRKKFPSSKKRSRGNHV